MRLTLAAVVVAAVALIPMGAMAGNQEFAEEIAASLRDSGQLQDYKIGVKFQDGTVWLRGRVADQEQMNAALKHVLQTPGVLRVVNNLEVAGEDRAAQPSSAGPATTLDATPLRQAPAAFGVESAPHLPAVDLSATASHAGDLSQTAARLQQASAGGQRIQTHSVEVVPAAARATMVATRSGEARPVRPSSRLPMRDTVQPASAQQPSSPTPAMTPLPAGVAMAPAAAMVAMMQQNGQPMPMGGAPMPQYITPVSGGTPPAQYDQPNMPNYAWPSYAANPNYAALTYPKVYSPTAWPYIGPFYPYPQVPLGWRKVVLEWHDGWWQLDFDDYPRSQWFSGLFRAPR